jgi:glucose-1-phosphate thymidylyltransferase
MAVFDRYGIVLAGGTGSRLFPLTRGVNKHLLQIYDKPMIYYALSVLMLAKIRRICIVCRREDQTSYKNLLGSGYRFGITITYIIQSEASGIADGIALCRHVVGNSSLAVVLGDNLFVGSGLTPLLARAQKRVVGATIFAYEVKHASDLGVVSLDVTGTPVAIEEKPENPSSNLAITGLYFFDNKAFEVIDRLKPSLRGELEVTDLVANYMVQNALNVEILGRGFAWLDTGTTQSLIRASGFIESIEVNQGLKIACLEEIALNHGWIDNLVLASSPDFNIKNSYGDYLRSLV